ncbi:hypothetical protein FZZ93_14550 [Halomonas eurihalina]|uniref:RiboL-PSP-HEPN domain-containing protein n=1 Tax=Halomonas eurihalina TaxID=42566 RepID=A0A5D9CU15_HALER|nr:hypothetical protein [Halomonas eurihalina]MDR5860418.1 hypothetical protein [Halomonas eurihalina]TZG33911.1 hypothetical protein FZZ93_14550 [Halomonas eurihalina]
MKLSPVQVSSYFIQKLGSMQIFIELSERQWREESSSYERSLVNEHESLSWDRYGYRNDLAANINQEFPQYQRQSQLIMIVSLFEDYLNQLCVSFKAENTLDVALTDIKGSGIDRAKTYLKKAVGIPFPSDGDSWKKIVEAQLIRNIVAHNAGHLDEVKHAKHLKVVRASDNLDAEVFARLHLIIEEGYLLSLVSAMERYAAALHKVSASG